MKRLTNRIVSFMLMLSLVSSMGVTAFADNSQVESSECYTVDEVAVAEAIREQIGNLSSEAKAIFLGSISDNHELVAYYKAYVDPSFIPTPRQMAVATANDPLKQLELTLKAIQLPSAVVVALMAAGSGIVAAVADGPLPFGDAYAALATAGAAAVLAAHWSVVGPKWPAIVKAFQDAFADSAKAILNAFNKLKENVLDMMNGSADALDYDKNGKTVTFQHKKYNCRTKASELTESHKKAGVYYVTLRIGNMLYCDTSNPVKAKTAIDILKENNPNVGIMSSTKAVATTVCSPILRDDPSHKPGQLGYFPHLHRKDATKAHCWYLLP